jgi:uncharacterized membrane protein YkgB
MIIPIPLMPRQRTAYLFARYSLAIVFIWFGAMTLTGVSAPIIERWIKGHVLFADVLVNSADIVRYLIGSFELLAGIMIALPKASDKIQKLGYMIVVIYALFALSLLFTNPVWMAALGGFPAIGAGQGIIKYIGIMGLALWCSNYMTTPWQRGSKDSIAVFLMLAGLIIVLGWIGGMKFTLPEAQGIDPLMKSSPFFSWITKLFDLQGASYFIGIVELITVVALLGWWFNRTVFHIGVILCFVTFLGTLSFLATFTPAWAGGFPNLSGGGHFLIKDLLLMAATFVLLAEDKQRR